MNKVNFNRFARDVRTVLTKHSPEILTGIGIAGMVTSTVLAVRATPKAMRLIEEERERLSLDAQDSEYTMTAMDKVKVAWKPYVPAAITTVASAACLIGASKVNLKRNAALATAYKLSETALTEYKEKVVETIGEKKEKAVRDKIAEDKVKDPAIVNQEVFFTGSGDSLFIDPLSGRKFKSNIDKIRRIQNKLNAKILGDAFDGGVSLNEFYSEIGLSSIDIGSDMGWSIAKGMLDVDFSAQVIEDEDGKEVPCLVLDYKVPPKYGYDSLG